MTGKRIAIYAVLITVVLILGLFWCYGRLQSQREAATTAARNLRTCRRLIQQIKHLQQQPAMASSQAIHLTDLTSQIEQVANRVHIDPEQLDRIWPEPSRRVGDSAYKEKPTDVLLENVSLKQLTGFLCDLVAEDRRLRISSLRLISPQSDDAFADTGTSPGNSGNSSAKSRVDRWSVEMTIGDLVYAPASGNDVGSSDLTAQTD